MITRDKASISGTAQNARQRIGEVIRHYREERNLLVREVAHRCKVSQGLVDDWEAGKALPSSDEWKALCRGVNRSLNPFTELYQRARKEAEEESRERAAASQIKAPVPMRVDTKINTALADKLAAARAPDPAPIVSIVRNPDPPQTAEVTKRIRRLPPAPPGALSAAQNVKRQEFVRNILRTRPHARVNGNDGLLALVRNTFGVGISPDTVEEIRTEVMAEMQAKNPPESAATAPQPIASAPLVEIKTPIDAPPNRAQLAHEAAIQAATGDHEADINAAVQLILQSIPNLQTFSVDVDETGEASVNYTVRKVVVTTDGGSFKVRR